MAAWIKMAVAVGVGLGPGDFVFDGDPATPPQKGAEPHPQFSAHRYCGQTAGWIKMKLGMQVGLDPSNIVLDGDQARPPQKGERKLPSNFRSISIVAKRLYGSR